MERKRRDTTAWGFNAKSKLEHAGLCHHQALPRLDKPEGLVKSTCIRLGRRAGHLVSGLLSVFERVDGILIKSKYIVIGCSLLGVAQGLHSHLKSSLVTSNLACLQQKLHPHLIDIVENSCEGRAYMLSCNIWMTLSHHSMVCLLDFSVIG